MWSAASPPGKNKSKVYCQLTRPMSGLTPTFASKGEESVLRKKQAPRGIAVDV